MAEPKLGSGERFKKLASKVGSSALAAWIGRKKYGNEKYKEMALKARLEKK